MSSFESVKNLRDFNNPLNLYDLFGYLLPGLLFLLLFLVDHIFQSVSSIQEFKSSLKMFLNFSWWIFIVIFLTAYFLGHFISSFSSLILERGIVKKILGMPIENLFNENSQSFCLFKNFRKSLDKKFINEFKLLIESRMYSLIESKDYYWLCYTYLSSYYPHLIPRIHHFVNLYGFSRNTSGALLCYVLFGIFYNCCFNPIYFLYLFLSALMLLNYTKLYKRQTLDLLFCYYNVVKKEQ